MADDNNPWNNDKYDPEAERACKDCGKTFKTKEGLLHGKYDFHCSPCHMYWKHFWRKVYIGGGILLIIIIVLVLVFVIKWLKNEDGNKSLRKRLKKMKRARRGFDEEDKEDDD
jgi:hypothetical protein